VKDFNNIEDWYKDELSNYSVEPDKDVWQSLADELDADAPLTDENISEWYKKEVVKLEERPDFSVWEKLSTKLDTSTVWDKLVVSLNQYDQLIWWRNLAFRGTAVFLLLFGSYLAYNNYTNTKAGEQLVTNSPSENLVVEKITSSKNSSSDYANKNKSAKIIPANNQTNTDDSNVSSTNSASINTQTTGEEKINKTISEIKSKTTELTKNSNKEPIYASIKNEPYFNSIGVDNLNVLKIENERTIITDINRHQLTENDITHIYESGDFLVKKDKNKIVFNSKRFSAYFLYGVYARRFYVGLNAGFKKHGMITSIKTNGALANYKQNDFLDFGSNVGATLGFVVSDNFNLETNINFISTSGYKREFSSEGLSYKENLNLNYSSVSLLAKKMNNKSTFDNKIYSTNFIGGIYAGYMTSATSEVNNYSQKLADYNKLDLGLVLGVEQDRYLTKMLVITPGVRYTQGILNIAGDNSPFRSSRNFSFEFNLGIKYIFLKKGN